MNEQTEIFDIVDECDEVIGSASREEVHRKGLKHRSVHLLVFNRKRRSPTAEKIDAKRYISGYLGLYGFWTCRLWRGLRSISNPRIN